MSDLYFTNRAPVGAAGGTKVVRGAAQRIVRAVPGSQGKNVQAEEVEYPGDYNQAEHWLEDLNVPPNGPASGFGRWERTNAELEQARSLPVDHMLGPLSAAEEKQILASDQRGSGLMSAATRVTRDPVTRIPSNVAEQDPRAESDSFFGSNKYPRQFDNVMQRYDEVDRTQEKVDYASAKVMPIKVIRRKT